MKTGPNHNKNLEDMINTLYIEYKEVQKLLLQELGEKSKKSILVFVENFKELTEKIASISVKIISPVQSILNLSNDKNISFKNDELIFNRTLNEKYVEICTFICTISQFYSLEGKFINLNDLLIYFSQESLVSILKILEKTKSYSHKYENVYFDILFKNVNYKSRSVDIVNSIFNILQDIDFISEKRINHFYNQVLDKKPILSHRFSNFYLNWFCKSILSKQKKNIIRFFNNYFENKISISKKSVKNSENINKNQLKNREDYKVLIEKSFNQLVLDDVTSLFLRNNKNTFSKNLKLQEEVNIHTEKILRLLEIGQKNISCSLLYKLANDNPSFLDMSLNFNFRMLTYTPECFKTISVVCLASSHIFESICKAWQKNIFLYFNDCVNLIKSDKLNKICQEEMKSTLKMINYILNHETQFYKILYLNLLENLIVLLKKLRPQISKVKKGLLIEIFNTFAALNGNHSFLEIFLENMTIFYLFGERFSDPIIKVLTFASTLANESECALLADRFPLSFFSAYKLEVSENTYNYFVRFLKNIAFYGKLDKKEAQDHLQNIIFYFNSIVYLTDKRNDRVPKLTFSEKMRGEISFEKKVSDILLAISNIATINSKLRCYLMFISEDFLKLISKNSEIINIAILQFIYVSLSKNDDVKERTIRLIRNEKIFRRFIESTNRESTEISEKKSVIRKKLDRNWN